MSFKIFLGGLGEGGGGVSEKELCWGCEDFMDIFFFLGGGSLDFLWGGGKGVISMHFKVKGNILKSKYFLGMPDNPEFLF